MDVDIVPMTTTTNGDLAFTTTLDACLDFFGMVNRNTPFNTVLERFSAAYHESPSDAFKILLNLRDARTGKGEKHLVHRLMVYLRHTLDAASYRVLLEQIIAYGSWQDVLKVKSPL